MRNKSMKPLSDYSSRKYKILPYDPNWPRQFVAHKEILKGIFGDQANSIEHIGSTAVPGLAGKPTIDILILVEDISVADRLEEQMEAAGYYALGEYVEKGARLFVKESDNTRYCNIHVFQKDHSHVEEMIQLRDYLLTHPEIVKEYSKLKTSLAERYPNNYGEYRKHKDEWMNKLKQRLFPH
ncbi:MAG: GrpB family protein [Candidatus Saccharimonadales bacterium]